MVRGAISAAVAAVLARFPPFELQALGCREIYLRTRDLLGGVSLAGADLGVQARQLARQSRYESGRVRTEGRRGHLTKLGRLVRRWRTSPDVHGHADVHKTRMLRGVPASDRKEGDHAVSPLRWWSGLGPAHVGALTDVGGPASRPHRGNRTGFLAACDAYSTADERECQKGGELLLRASDEMGGGRRKKEGAKLPLREVRKAEAVQRLWACIIQTDPDCPAIWWLIKKRKFIYVAHCCCASWFYDRFVNF